MALSENIPDGYTQVEQWPFDRLIHANEMIDAIEAATAKQRRKAKPKPDPFRSRR